MTKKLSKYIQLGKQLESLIVGIDNNLGHFSNLTSLIKTNFRNVSWVGFYFYDNIDRTLKLGPFQGKIACQIIKINRGVCGKAFDSKRSLIVPDVHSFEGHIACDCNTNSEIVIPFRFKNIQGVLDLDSHRFNNFTEEDEKGLTALLNILEKHIN